MTPPDFGSTGSRSTYCGGIVAKRACEDVKRKLYRLAHENSAFRRTTWALSRGTFTACQTPRRLTICSRT